MRILVVWEPILVTDWGAPSSSTLARISDPRARQFWDPSHQVSLALEKVSAHAPRPKSGKGFYWDMALVFPPPTPWENHPAPSFWQGPVFKIIPPLKQFLPKQ